MLEFNNNHIVTGFIKQLLATFNLPKCRIYTIANQRYFEKMGKESPEIIKTRVLIKNSETEAGTINQHTQYIPYIKDDIIQEYIYDTKTHTAEWRAKGEVNLFTGEHFGHLHHYEFGMHIPNYTKTLEIKSNIYDSYTHEYLGDYLRFLRDYRNIDLMPLYNCFSNKIYSNVSYKIVSITNIGAGLSLADIAKDKGFIAFNTDNPSFKVYAFPVKLFKKYTIAIDCDSTLEICCGLYGKYQDTRPQFEFVPSYTYQSYASTKFNKPFIYDRLTIDNNKLFEEEVELAANEIDLKMFIKVPATNSSTIVVLEGDYTGWSDMNLDIQDFTLSSEQQRDVAAKRTTVPKIIPPASGNILYAEMENDTNGYYYIKKTNRTIINYEKYISDNNNFENLVLKTPLQLLRLNTTKQYPFADKLIEYLAGNVICPLDKNPDNIERVQKIVGVHSGYNFKFKGIWEDIIRASVYDYMNTNCNTYELNHDILGYIDKDVEVKYTTGDKKTIASVDIYPNIYKDSKK